MKGRAVPHVRLSPAGEKVARPAITDPPPVGKGNATCFHAEIDLCFQLQAPPIVENAHPVAVSDLIDNFSAGLAQVERASVMQSTAYEHLEATQGHWDHLRVKLENMLSDTENADLATAVVELQAHERAYEVSLAASAAMFDKSLIDFLR